MNLSETNDDPFRPIPVDMDPRRDGRLWRLVDLPEIQKRVDGEGIRKVFLTNDTKYWLSMLSDIIEEPEKVRRGSYEEVSFDGETVKAEWLHNTMKEWGEAKLQHALGPYDYVAREVIKELSRLKNECGILLPRKRKAAVFL